MSENILLLPYIKSNQKKKKNHYDHTRIWRRAKYKQNRLNGMDCVNAAIAAGYTESYAKGKAYRIERSVKVGLRDVAIQLGLTDEFMIKYAVEALSAMELNFITGQKCENWNARHKFFTSLGIMTDRIKPNSTNVNIDNSKHTHYHIADRMKKAREKVQSRYAHASK